MAFWDQMMANQAAAGGGGGQTQGQPPGMGGSGGGIMAARGSAGGNPFASALAQAGGMGGPPPPRPMGETLGARGQMGGALRPGDQAGIRPMAGYRNMRAGGFQNTPQGQQDAMAQQAYLDQLRQRYSAMMGPQQMQAGGSGGRMTMPQNMGQMQQPGSVPSFMGQRR
jgi:hypothetical protein